MKGLVIALLIISSSFTQISSQPNLQDLFDAWKAQYHKSYPTALEEAQRYQIFVENYEFIENFNEANHSCKLGLNQYSDLTNPEFKAMHTGLRHKSDEASVFTEDSFISATPSQFKVSDGFLTSDSDEILAHHHTEETEETEEHSDAQESRESSESSKASGSASASKSSQASQASQSTGSSQKTQSSQAESSQKSQSSQNTQASKSSSKSSSKTEAGSAQNTRSTKNTEAGSAQNTESTKNTESAKNTEASQSNQESKAASKNTEASQSNQESKAQSKSTPASKAPPTQNTPGVHPSQDKDSHSDSDNPWAKVIAEEEEQQQQEEDNPFEFKMRPYADQWDWQSEGALTPVKDQGVCGSCWAFSSTAALESLKFINTGVLGNLSEQQLIDCDTNDYGCDGGFAEGAFNYVASNGIMSYNDYPYTSYRGKKGPQCKFVQSKADNVNTGFLTVKANDTLALKSAIFQTPVVVGVDASSVLQHYKSGVIDASSGCSASTDHAVLAVGYGNFEGQDSFKVRNSWGTKWGVQGYFYISTKDDNNGAGSCGLLMNPIAPVGRKDVNTPH